MKRLISCIASVALVAIVLGIAVYYAMGGGSPAKKMMKEHPYTFSEEKDIGTEKRDTYTKDGGCVYVAYPKTKSDTTNQELKAFMEAAKEQFAARAETPEEGQILRLIIDYETAKGEGYSALNMRYELALLNQSGQSREVASQEKSYYLNEDHEILGLNDVLGEDSEEKLNILLRSAEKSTEDMADFTVNGDTLILRWADGTKKEFSVQAVQRAGLIDPEKPMVALTFDDGPGKYTREFADLLAEYGGHGTYFVLGINVPVYAEDLKYAYEMGNEIASHTMRHKDLNKLSAPEVKKEISDAANAIHQAIGAYPTLMRPPYGNANNTVLSVVDTPVIKWSVDTLDWQSRNAQTVKRVALNEVKDGDIVLLHEIYESSYEGTKLILEELSKKGYQFVTVSELMQYRNVKPEVKVYYSCYPQKQA